MCHVTTILPISTSITCPECRGDGEIDHMQPNPCGDTQYRRCYKCKGTGKVKT
jgi:DnaJ-class molecular chaperone